MTQITFLATTLQCRMSSVGTLKMRHRNKAHFLTLSGHFGGRVLSVQYSHILGLLYCQMCLQELRINEKTTEILKFLVILEDGQNYTLKNV
jgi:hypothetical protein